MASTYCEPGAAEEAVAYRLLVLHGRRGALRHLVRMEDVQKWPDESVYALVQLLLSRGAEQVLTPQDVENTQAWAQQRLKEAESAGGDTTHRAKLVDLLADDEEQPMCDAELSWGCDPAANTKEVLLHVLRRCSREQQRQIASYHPDNASAMLAVSAGAGKGMRDNVHWLLALGANVNGLTLRRQAMPPRAATCGGSRADQDDATSSGCSSNGHVQQQNGKAGGPCSGSSSRKAANGSCCSAQSEQNGHSNGVPASPDAGEAGSKPEPTSDGSTSHGLSSQAPASKQQEQQQEQDEDEEEDEVELQRRRQEQQVLCPLAEAAAAGDIYVMQVLLDVHGADPTAYGGLPEYMANLHGKPQAAKVIFEHAVSRKAQAAANGSSNGGVADPHQPLESPWAAKGQGAAAGPGGMRTPNGSGMTHSNGQVAGGGSGQREYQYVSVGDLISNYFASWARWGPFGWIRKMSQAVSGSQRTRAGSGRGRPQSSGSEGARPLSPRSLSKRAPSRASSSSSLAAADAAVAAAGKNGDDTVHRPVHRYTSTSGSSGRAGPTYLVVGAAGVAALGAAACVWWLCSNKGSGSGAASSSNSSSNGSSNTGTTVASSSSSSS